MGRVVWSLLEPGTVEQLVGIFLCRENLRATRIRPSQGDGGIDVLVPAPDDPRVVDVYQVKCFHQNLTGGQKAQIEKSYGRVRRFADAQGLTISAWYLTLPLVPTNENRQWFLELTADAGFPCEWRGLDYLESLAAKYPDVVDYYLHDGKDRLDQAILALTNVLQLGQRLPRSGRLERTDPSAALQPVETLDGLAALHETLNRHDPHFRYDFAVDHERPDIPESPFLVAAVQQGDAHRCISFKIFARYLEAVVDRPVPGRFQIKAEPGSDLHRDLELFHRYGRPIQTPLGAAAMTFDLPGGLGGSFDAVQLTIGPFATSRSSHELRLAMLDEGGVVVAAPLVQIESATQGVSGRGARAFGTEENGTFTIEMLIDGDTGRTKIEVVLGDLSGRRPEKLLEGLRFLAHYRSPYRVDIRSAYGPGAGSAEPFVINAGPEFATAMSLVRDFAEALVTIQQVAPVRVDMPDPDDVTPQQVSDVLETARLIRGETLTRPWTTFGPVHLHPGIEPDLQSRMALRSLAPLVVRLPAVEFQVGLRNVVCLAARIDADSVVNHEDHQDVQFVPADNNLAAITFTPANDLLMQGQRQMVEVGQLPSDPATS